MGGYDQYRLHKHMRLSINNLKIYFLNGASVQGV